MPTNLLQQQANDLFGVFLTAEQIAQFDRFQTELADWNTRMNLTAIIEPEAVRIRHFLDSLSVVQGVSLKAGNRVVDVGTGAGFPGLPLAIAFPDIVVTMMDSTGKKITFVQHIIDTLGLKNAQAIKIRAEDAGRLGSHRGNYDIVLARAVARLPALLEYTLPLAKIGGFVVAMKGETAEQETTDARRAILAFGGALDRLETVILPDRTHHLVIVKKISRTPPEFPRPVGIPTRQPIE